MKFFKEQVEKYQFRFDNEDIITVDGHKINLDGNHAVFLLDTKNFILAIESDWGRYCFRCICREPFKDLLLRESGMFIYQMIPNIKEINWEYTKRNAIEKVLKSDKCKDVDIRKKFLNEIGKVDLNEIRFYDFVCSYAPELWKGAFIYKDYPLGVKILVKIFEKYLKNELRKEKAGGIE